MNRAIGRTKCTVSRDNTKSIESCHQFIEFIGTFHPPFVSPWDQPSNY